MKYPNKEQAMNAMTEAIANADAHTNNAGLPTYSELVAALRLAHQQMQKSDGESHAWHEANDSANALLARIPS